jgi:outer membrane protein assembly factor BamE (lipoprotein component of BamABCDE complex)
MRAKPFYRPARAALLAGAVLVAACAPTVQIHGYVPPQAEVARVRPGVDTMATVEELLGRPSSSGLLRDRAWYYVQSTVANYTYNPPRVVDRTVLAVEFAPDGVVQAVNRYGLEDGRVVNLTTRTTETGGRTLGVLEQLFSNLLNIDAEQVLGDQPR